MQLQSSFQPKMYRILYCREEKNEAIHKQLIIRQSRNNNKTKQRCLPISWNTFAFFGWTKTKQGLCHSLSVKVAITTKQSKGVLSSHNQTKWIFKKFKQTKGIPANLKKLQTVKENTSITYNQTKQQ